MAQLKVFPIERAGSASEDKVPVNARTAEDEPLSLPFWDDFSFTDHQPADTLWQNSQNVYINNGLASNPPSIGVASFDGLDASGKALGLGESETGKTDSLTSRPIDLSGLSAAANVYISFFYQYAGTGEGPDQGDSLRLEFKNSDGAWISVWPRATGINRTGTFTQAIEKVNDPAFFHDSFQFRFQTFGLQSGPYDIWNVDYVYLNKGRSETDTSFPDRTINVPLTSFLKDYTAIPYYHFNINDTIHPTFGIANLKTTSAPQPIEYQILTNTFFMKSGEALAPIVDTYEDPRKDPIRPGLDNTEIIKLPEVFSDISDQDADTAIVDIKISINSGDNTGDYDPAIYAPIDFRRNDTTSASFMLSNYYAYDDGTAEYAAALNASGTSIAYKYNMAKDTTDHIVAMDIYFPYIGTDPAGRSIDLTIWRSIAESSTGTNALAHRETVTIVRNPELNSFVRYTLKTSIAVTDSFYIGYTQNSAGYLGVGLDKNTNSGSKIYSNLNGTWQQNEIISGSLMIRPVFGPAADTLTTGTDPVKVTPSIKVYPNPSTGIFQLEGKFQRLKMFDLRGVEKSFSLTTDGDDAILDIQDQPAGIYIIQFVHDNSLHTLKVLKE